MKSSKGVVGACEIFFTGEWMEMRQKTDVGNGWGSEERGMAMRARMRKGWMGSV